jgi:transcriptional regulator with XRE-family HTH domain
MNRDLIPEWTFADRLRKSRRSAGMTQRQMSAALEVGEAAYGQWESGNNVPREVIEIARRVEKITGVRATWLLGLESA